MHVSVTRVSLRLCRTVKYATVNPTHIKGEAFPSLAALAKALPRQRSSADNKQKDILEAPK